MHTVRRDELARQALIKAHQVRQQGGIDITEAVDAIDFVASLGIEVRFVDLPSLEAMYVKAERPNILLSYHRPTGRRAFNCAHELGHHVFNHGTKIDEYLETKKQKGGLIEPAEFLADRFASFFLMPKTLVEHAFHCRSWRPTTSTPRQFYAIAGWLGVGYSTLIIQMRDSLSLLSWQKAAALLKSSPMTIRTQVLGESGQQHLTIVDLHWKGRAADSQVGDLILVPPDTDFEGSCLQQLPFHGNGSLFQAVTPGIGRFAHRLSGWAAYTRVARQNYIGRSLYRYLQDPDHVITAALQ